MLSHADPTVYARVDYFTNDENLTDEQKASWQVVLTQLPVVFTFAPMNLLHYRVAFAPGAVRTVAVTYRQYAYLDTRSPRSYQIAYVIHPASLWESFGPIHLTVSAPEGVKPVGSVALRDAEGGPHAGPPDLLGRPGRPLVSRVATLTQKTGELFVAINADEWTKVVTAAMPQASGAKKVASTQ